MDSLSGDMGVRKGIEERRDMIIHNVTVFLEIFLPQVTHTIGSILWRCRSFPVDTGWAIHDISIHWRYTFSEYDKSFQFYPPTVESDQFPQQGTYTRKESGWLRQSLSPVAIEQINEEVWSWDKSHSNQRTWNWIEIEAWRYYHHKLWLWNIIYSTVVALRCLLLPHTFLSWTGTVELDG